MEHNRPTPAPIRRAATLAGIALVALVHAALWALYYWPEPKVLTGDEVLYRQAARDLAAGAESALGLLWPPLYARFLALVPGGAEGSLLPVQALQTAMLLAAAALLRAVALRLGASPAAAAGVALLALAYPPLAAFSHYLWPETLHLLLLLGALWILVARPGSRRWMPLLGLLLGLALLTKSLIGPFLPVLLLPLLLTGAPRRRAACLGLALAALLATVAPTLIANHRRTGEWLIADSATFNVWVGLNERSRRNFEEPIVWDEYVRFRDSAASHGERNRILRSKIRALIRERGLGAVLRAQLGRQYFRLFDRASFLTDQLPGGRIWRGGGGYQRAPAAAGHVLRLVSYGLYAAILVGAVFGWLVYRPRGGAGQWLLLAFLGYNLAVFLVVHVKTRYRIQLLPVLLVGVAFTLDRLLAGRPAPGSRWAAAAATALSAGLLLLAFADLS